VIFVTSNIIRFFVSSGIRDIVWKLQEEAFLFDVEIPKGANVLDVGAGYGTGTIWLQKQTGGKVTGIEPDPELVKLAKRNVSRQGLDDVINIEEGDATDLQFQNDTFDVATAFLVLHHIDDTEKALSEINRVLKPGGMFIVNDIFPVAFAPQLPIMLYWSHTVGEIEKLFSAYGFEVVDNKQVLRTLYSFVRKKQ